MNSGHAITRALAMEPDRPGVARLCQELLADLAGQKIPAVVRPEQVRLHPPVWRRGAAK